MIRPPCPCPTIYVTTLWLRWGPDQWRQDRFIYSESQWLTRSHAGTHTHTARTSTLKRSSPHFVQADDAMSCPTKRTRTQTFIPPRQTGWVRKLRTLRLSRRAVTADRPRNCSPIPLGTGVNYRRVFNCGGQCLRQTCPDREKTVNKRALDWDPKFNLSLHSQILFDHVSHHFLEWHCVRLCGAEFRVMSIIRFRSCSGHRVHTNTEKPGYSHASIHDKYFINTSIPVNDYGIIFADDRHCLRHKSQQIWKMSGKKSPLLHVVHCTVKCQKKDQTSFLFQ